MKTWWTYTWTKASAARGRAAFSNSPKGLLRIKRYKSFRPPFSKGGGVEGRRPRRVPQDAKLPCLLKAQEGRKTSRRDVFRWGTLAGGSPRRVCILSKACSANWRIGVKFLSNAHGRAAFAVRPFVFAWRGVFCKCYFRAKAPKTFERKRRYAEERTQKAVAEGG